MAITGSDRGAFGEGTVGFRMLRLGFLSAGRFASSGRPGPDIDEPRPSPNKLETGSGIGVDIDGVCGIGGDVDGNVDVAEVDEEDSEHAEED